MRTRGRSRARRRPLLRMRPACASPRSRASDLRQQSASSAPSASANGAARSEPLLIGAAWPDLADSLIDTEAAAEVGWLIETVEAIRSLKGEMNVATARPPLSFIAPDAATTARVERYRDILTTLARVSEVSVVETAPDGAVTFVAGGASAALTLAGLVDIAAERVEKRLRRYKRRLRDHHRGRRADTAAILAQQYVIAADAEQEQDEDSAEPEGLSPTYRGSELDRDRRTNRRRGGHADGFSGIAGLDVFQSQPWRHECSVPPARRKYRLDRSAGVDRQIARRRRKHGNIGYPVVAGRAR